MVAAWSEDMNWLTWQKRQLAISEVDLYLEILSNDQSPRNISEVDYDVVFCQLYSEVMIPRFHHKKKAQLRKPLFC